MCKRKRMNKVNNLSKSRTTLIAKSMNKQNSPKLCNLKSIKTKKKKNISRIPSIPIWNLHKSKSLWDQLFKWKFTKWLNKNMINKFKKFKTTKKKQLMICNHKSRNSKIQNMRLRALWKPTNIPFSNFKINTMKARSKLMT